MGRHYDYRSFVSALLGKGWIGFEFVQLFFRESAKWDPIDNKPLTHSAEMLNSPRMKQLVDEMKSRYHSRIIIFDLPPVLSSADALAFSPYVDAALLVVEEGVTQKQDIEHAVELLKTTNIVGTVLNKAETKG